MNSPSTSGNPIQFANFKEICHRGREVCVKQMSAKEPNYSERSEEDLMLAYQEGDSRAFDELYDRTADKLYGYLERRITSPEHVDEIFQSTMAKFHQTRFQYRPPLPVLPWLFTICRTVMIDSARKQARLRETFDDDMDKYQDHEAAAQSETSPASQPAFSEGMAGLRTLSSSQKEALALRFEQDLSFEDIAKRLETTPANARQLISRAVRKLKSFATKKGDGK